MARTRDDRLEPQFDRENPVETTLPPLGEALPRRTNPSPANRPLWPILAFIAVLMAAVSAYAAYNFSIFHSRSEQAAEMDGAVTAPIVGAVPEQRAPETAQTSAPVQAPPTTTAPPETPAPLAPATAATPDQAMPPASVPAEHRPAVPHLPKPVIRPVSKPASGSDGSPLSAPARVSGAAGGPPIDASELPPLDQPVTPPPADH